MAIHYSEQVVVIRKKPTPHVGDLTITVNLLESTLSIQPTPPFFGLVDIVPAPFKHQNKGFISPSIFRTDSDIAFNQDDWPNPKIKKTSHTGFIDTRIFEEAPTPIYGITFPNPEVKKREYGFINNRTIEDTRLIPGIIFPNPKYADKPNVGFTDTIVHEVINPIINIIYPVPQRHKSPVIDWFQSLRPTSDPITTIIFPNPNIRRSGVIDWIQSGKAILDSIFPVGRQVYDNPLPRRRRAIDDWIQPRPRYYTEPTSIAGTQVWALPPRRAKRLIVTISTINLNPTPSPNPFGSKVQWPNPVLKPRRGLGWIDYYIFESPPPIITSSHLFALPQRRKVQTHTWIDTNEINLIGSAAPIKPYDYPLPLRYKRQTHSWIVNLLQSLLDPGAPDKPFHQEEFPNPIIGKRNLNIGIVEGRKFYYDEPPLQIIQSDWPVFRPLRRSHVGFIDYKIQTSESLFAAAIDIPIRKRAQAISFIDNPIRIMTSIPGAVPFNQLDWPIFRKVQVAVDILTWLGQNMLVVTQVVGRRICLFADDTEYRIEVTQKDHGYEARVEVHNIEVGGKECQ